MCIRDSPITLWPFPTKAIAAYADKVKGMLVTELNAGQMIEDVRLAVNGKVKVCLLYTSIPQSAASRKNCA